ncbi:MAG: 23S rRNA (adenine(2030)-N(6))-methyltransferase RlmJ [Roseiarcus sp.]|uniref:23S rRNA (adenine(2030)-N(6))-methyltransferase RlmJ n=1 Tax=Roseiarcus sp. TaxID=1969460 RepID=UPI003C3B6E58
MNYRHAFHAGSFSDVLKHAVLARILVHLKRKEAPFRFIDTHAGAGRYDLSGDEARRSPEWREGIARILMARPPAPVGELLRSYLQAVGPHDAEGRPVAYPGSPAIAQTLMRAQDRIALCEANPDEREALIAALGRDRRLSIVSTDGYVALNAYLPPKERRGVILIDPPFEAPGEAGDIVHPLERALRKWPTGAYVAWRPIRDARDDARFLNAVAALGAPNILRLELDIGPGPIGAHGQEPLTRAGLLVVNPPHPLVGEARTLLPWLAQTLGRGEGGKQLCDWVTAPK